MNKADIGIRPFGQLVPQHGPHGGDAGTGTEQQWPFAREVGQVEIAERPIHPDLVAHLQGLVQMAGDPSHILDGDLPARILRA